jgi:hypothetical protein
MAIGPCKANADMFDSTAKSIVDLTCICFTHTNKKHVDSEVGEQEI